MEYFQTDNLSRALPPVETSSELKKVVEKMESEMGPTGYEEEGKMMKKKREREKARRQRIQRQKREYVAGLQRKTGTSMSERDFVVRKVVGWNLKSSLALCCRHCGQPVTKNDIEIHEGHAKFREILEERNLSSYYFNPYNGNHHLIDVVGGKPHCKFCGEELENSKHWNENDDGKLECPKFADEIERRADYVQRVNDVIENGGKITIPG